MSVQQNWDRIADWYRTNAPQMPFRLASGASEQQIASLEEAIGVRLPEDVRESYRLHDGTDGTALAHFREVLSLAEIEALWRQYEEWRQNDEWGSDRAHEIGGSRGPDWYRAPDAETERPADEEAIKPVWWTPRRIPITEVEGVDPLFVDLDPNAGGASGQIIDYSHETGPLRVLASSWSEWLGDVADALEAGRLAYSEDDEMVLPPGFYG